MRNCLRKLRSIKADAVFATLAVAFGLFFLWYSIFEVRHPAYIVAAAMALLTSVAYLALRGKIKELHFLDAGYSWRLDIAYWLVFAGAILSYIFRPLPYERPLWFFALVAMACGIITLKLIWREPQGRGRLLCLLQVISLGLLLAWSVTLMYPTLVGQDPVFHRYLTLSMMNNNFVDWQTMPLMHIIIAFTMKLYGIDYRIATMLSVSLASIVLDAVFIYLIGRRLVNARVGLLAALLLTVSNWHVFFAYWTIQNTLALTLMLASAWSFLEWRHSGGRKLIAFSSITMLLMLITHPLGTIWLGMFLTVAFTVYWWRSRKFPVAIAVAVVLYSGAVLAWWGLFTGHLGTLFYFILLRFDPVLLEMEATWQVVGGASLPSVPSEMVATWTETISSHPWQLLYGGLGMFLLFCLGAFGSFALLRMRDVKCAVLSVTGMMVLSIGIIPTMVGMAVLENRWWYFAEALLAIPAALCIFYIAKIKEWLAYIAVSFLSLLLVLGLPANADNGALAEDLIVRYALTHEEIEAAEYALDNYGGTIGMDAYYVVTIGNMLEDEKYRLVDITQSLLHADFTDTGAAVLVVRNEVASNPFGFGEGKIYRLNYVTYTTLLEQGFEPIFINDGAIVYKKY